MYSTCHGSRQREFRCGGFRHCGLGDDTMLTLLTIRIVVSFTGKSPAT
jgi:hypothetical protein